MKFIIIKRKNIIITLIFFILVFAIIFLLLNFNNNVSIQTSSNELEDFYSKIQNLTNQKEKKDIILQIMVIVIIIVNYIQVQMLL